MQASDQSSIYSTPPISTVQPEHVASSQKEIWNSKHLSSPAEIVGLSAPLGRSNGASRYDCGPNEGFPPSAINFDEIPGRLYASPDAYNRRRNPEAVHVGECSQNLNLQAARSAERTRQGDSSLSVQRSLPMMTFRTAAQAVEPFIKRTKEDIPVFTKRDFLLDPPPRGWRYRPQLVMADGAEAGPNSIKESQAQAQASLSSKMPAETSDHFAGLLSTMETFELEAQESVSAFVNAVNASHDWADGQIYDRVEPVIRLNCSVHVMRRQTQVRLLSHSICHISHVF